MRLASSLLLSLAALAAHAEGAIRLVVQSSPLAGFRYYEAKDVWGEMRVGDRLELVRETENIHDANAVSVSWRGRKLGYVPRRENAAIARERLRLGTIVPLELRAAQEKYLDAENRLVSARYEAKRGETELLRLAARLGR